MLKRGKNGAGPQQSPIHCFGKLGRDWPAAADGFATASPSTGARILPPAAKYLKPRLVAFI